MTRLDNRPKICYACGGSDRFPRFFPDWDSVTGGDRILMYPFLTLDDGMEIVHSEMYPDGRVKVYMEKPDAKDGFHHAVCWLPDYAWEDVRGLSPLEVSRCLEVIRSTAHLILRFAQEGGFDNAAGL